MTKLKNEVIVENGICTVLIPNKQGGEESVYHLKMTKEQLQTVEDAGVTVIGMYTYENGTTVARGRGIVDGKKKQPMIHGLLGFKVSDMANLLDFTEVVKEDPFDIPEPVVEVKKPEKKSSTKKEPKIYDEPLEECSELPIRGVSWNKRKNRYEAKATHKDTKKRQFLGYYEPAHVHIANNAVRRYLMSGPKAYTGIMQTYYKLYPKKRR